MTLSVDLYQTLGVQVACDGLPGMTLSVDLYQTLGVQVACDGLITVLSLYKRM